MKTGTTLLFLGGALLAACTAGGAPGASTEPAGQTNADAGSGTVGSSGAPADPGLMPTSASAWRQFSPRTSSMPVMSVGNASSGYVLQIAAGGTANVYGGWTTRMTGLQSGAWYRFGARAHPENISSIREAVTIVLRWRGSFGDEVSPDYAWHFQKQADGSVVFDRTIQAPSGTTAVDVELVLQWAPLGRIAFDQLSFTPTAPPPARRVRVAAIRYRPTDTASGFDSVQRAARYAEQVAIAQHPDVMVLGELLNMVGAPGTFESNAETVPGPSTDFVASVARAQRVNIGFGLVERSGDALYNTAVLLDRSGNIIGKHRKVQLPLFEAAGGILPGDSVPVFDADFGRVALLICQETSFPEPAREAALQGAEIFLVPVWGGKATLVHARAVETGVPLAASGYDYATEVVDSLGNVLASVDPGGGPGVAVADIDLSQRHREDWLGDWRDIAMKERRTKPYQYQLP